VEDPQLPRHRITCISRLHKDTTRGRGRGIARRRRRWCIRTPTPHRVRARTRALRKHPPCQAIRNVTNIAVRRPHSVPQVSAGGDAAGIVYPRRAVVRLLLGAVSGEGCIVEGCVIGGELIHNPRQAVPRGCPGDAVEEHACDDFRWARVDADAGVGAGVRLHEARVLVGAVGCLHADAAFGFLHHDREDEARVHICYGCDGEDAAAHSCGLLEGVIWPASADIDAAVVDEGEVGGPAGGLISLRYGGVGCGF
jgi:hypothetical protein